MSTIPTRSPATTRARRLTLSAVVAAAVVGSSATAWSATTGPTPVKADPRVSETAPAAHGPWLGWSQNRPRHLGHTDFFVQRGDGDPLRVNTPDTEGLGGDIVAGRVVYAQQYGDRDPRINVFDPATGTRTALPDKVNHRYHRAQLPGSGTQRVRWLATVRGDVSASGPWVLYSGVERQDPQPPAGAYDDRTVMLYNRQTGALKTLDLKMYDVQESNAGQVNGRWVAYRDESDADYRSTTVHRYDIRTGETQSQPASADSMLQSTPAVASDGTVYYAESDQDCFECGPDVLYRWPVGGSPEVVAAATALPSTRLYGLRVKDLPDGSRALYVSTQQVGTHDADGDIFRVVDDPSTAP